MDWHYHRSMAAFPVIVITGTTAASWHPPSHYRHYDRMAAFPSHYWHYHRMAVFPYVTHCRRYRSMAAIPHSGSHFPPALPSTAVCFTPGWFGAPTHFPERQVGVQQYTLIMSSRTGVRPAHTGITCTYNTAVCPGCILFSAPKTIICTYNTAVLRAVPR